jgi:hypothetical protein
MREITRGIPIGLSQIHKENPQKAVAGFEDAIYIFRLTYDSIFPHRSDCL